MTIRDPKQAPFSAVWAELGMDEATGALDATQVPGSSDPGETGLSTIWVNPTPDPPSFWRSIDRPLLMGLGIALTAFFGRKHLLRNAANRRVFLLLALTVASMFLHRLIAAYFGLSLAISLLNDALVIAATSAIAALFVAPWAVWMMVVMLSVVAAMVAWPTASEPLLAVGVVAVMSLASVLDYRATQSKRQ